jgi:adenine/guanine phosphoribosyltransferase-like PRPP-binding protein
VVLVDDVINTGASALAAIRLLQKAGAHVAGLVVALTEGQAWREALAVLGEGWPDKVHAIGHIPCSKPPSQGAGGPCRSLWSRRG